MIKVFEATDIGRVRPINEDSKTVFDPAVYAVADGMGGEAAGEVASRILTDTIRRELERRDRIGWAMLEHAVQAANDNILQYVQEHPSCQGMGTTATVLHIDADTNEAIWAHVGDSRLYCLHDGAFRQVTRDHSYVADLVEQGTITPEEARVHPKKNMLTRAVGVEPNLRVDTGNWILSQGDILLLATDGLMKQIPDGDICATLLTHPADPARTLVDMALNAGGTDNVTAIVVVFGA